MARWHRSPEALEAARLWRDRCLLADRSILSDYRLWTLENLLHLDRHFVQNLDEGEGDFLQKLEAQLAPAPPAAKQLAAEILWILYLSVSERGMKGATKRIQIRRVWEWSGEPFLEAPLLGIALDRGVGFPGTAFNTGRWRELVFCIELFRDWKRLPASEAESLIADPWRFAQWVDRHPASKNRQFRHMLLYLLFPDSFERVMTSSHKEQILRRLGPKLGLDVVVDGMDRTSVDRALMDLRRRLEERFDGAEADYYADSIRDEWQGLESAPKGGDRKATVSRPSEKERALWRELQQPGDRRIWLIAPGEGARLWQEFQRDGICAIGWDELGDLSAYPTYEAAYGALREVRGGNPSNDANACFEFAHRMQPGDLVIAKQGRSVILGVGEVISGYRFEDGRPEYRSVRDVRWQHVGSWTLPDEHQMVAKTLTDMTRYPAWVQAATNAMRGEAPGGTDVPGPEGAKPYGVEDALSEVFLTQLEFTHIVDALGRRKNVILEGAPGVGKTYVAKRIAWALMGEKDDSRVQMVQFHQSYAYEDFVQGWRPQAQGFSLQNGVFYRFCERARLDPNRKYVFIIDEINRGNLSKIFGELFMLVESDKRDAKYAVPLVYSPDETFYVPGNVYLLGMMNTADRSLAMVDYALRRRFSFNRISPAFMSEGFSNYLTNAGATDDLIKKIQDRMGELNEVIAADTRNLGPGYQIGHSFFVPEDGAGNLDEDWYKGVVNEEIAPLLREYWFGREEQAQQHVNRLLS